MKFPRFLPLFVVFSGLVSTVFAANPPQAQSPAGLPQEFAGWQVSGAVKTSTDPAVADSSNAGGLQEYRFTDLATATYTRDDGRTLKIRAARFADASGAFGAYTFYLQPGMAKLQISENPETDKTPQQGVSNGKR